MSTLSQFTSAVKSIQRGTISIVSTASATASISAVNTAKAHLALLGSNTPNTSLISSLVRISLSSSTGVTATLGGAVGGSAFVVSYEVIEFY